MKKLMMVFFLVLSTIICNAQDVKVTTCYFYMDENNRFSYLFEAINLRPNDTLVCIEFRFQLFSSQSNLQKNQYHIVPLYNMINREHIPSNEAIFGVFSNAPCGKTVKANEISWRHNAWYTKMNDVIGARILKVTATYKSGYTVELDGYPKNSRVRKGDEHPPFYL